MAFAYEFISDEDQKKLAAFNPEGGLQNVNVLEWTIDRELDAFLVWVRPEKGPPDGAWYAFVWRGAVFHVLIHEQSRTRRADGRWKVSIKMKTLSPAGMPPQSFEARSALILLHKAVQLEIREKELRTGEGKDIAEVQINTSSSSWIAREPTTPYLRGTSRG